MSFTSIKLMCLKKGRNPVSHLRDLRPGLTPWVINGAIYELICGYVSRFMSQIISYKATILPARTFTQLLHNIYIFFKPTLETYTLNIVRRRKCFV